MDRRIPRWGWVAAAPHEYLVVLRRGEVIRGQQGGSCFKRWTDTVALIDTSLRRLQFTADQVTLEKTGVQVTGLAVFRVVEPLLAYRMLDLSDSGDEVHAEILQQMLLGATRRLVANLTLEACLTQRKAALAAELMAEIAPVVGGSGAAGDGASQGWGLAIDTIEIQDVRVLSEEVFHSLQAPYREALALEALQARDEVSRAEASLAHAAEQRAEERRAEQHALEQARRAAERQAALQDAQHTARLQQEAHEAKLARERDASDAALEVAARASASARQIAEADAESELRVARVRAEAEQVLGLARAEIASASRSAHDEISEARLRELMITDTLPEVARAFAGSVDRIVVTGASDLSVLGDGVATVLAAADAVGLPLGLRGSTDEA